MVPDYISDLSSLYVKYREKEIKLIYICLIFR